MNSSDTFTDFPLADLAGGNGTSSPIDVSSACKTRMPSVIEFSHSMNVQFMAMLAIGGSFTLATIVVFWRQYPSLKAETPKEYFSKTVVLCGIYQVISVLCMISMFVPKAFVLCDTLEHFIFLFGAYNLITLFVQYVGGESKLLQLFPNDNSFVVRTPPCCCCCLCCRPMIVNKGRFTFIWLLLGQFILIQGVVFVALNVIYIEDPDLYNVIFFYFVPVFFTSIMMGVWGLNITTRLLAPKFPDLNLRGKYFALQLILFFNKLQHIIGAVIISNVDFDCEYPLTTGVYKQGIIEVIVTVQMFLLSLWARNLYRRPTKYGELAKSVRAEMLET